MYLNIYTYIYLFIFFVFLELSEMAVVTFNSGFVTPVAKKIKEVLIESLKLFWRAELS